MCSCWDAISKQARLQHNKIQASFEHSIFRPPHKYKVDFYKNLLGYVSTSALDFIAEEIRRVSRYKCGCAIRSTHGLPCACELAGYRCVPLKSVHPFWRRLSWKAVNPNEDPDDMNLEAEIAAIRARFGQADLLTKKAMKEKMREFAWPDSTKMCPPPKKVVTKGRKKGKSEAKSSTKRIPSFFEHVDAQVKSREATNSTNPSMNNKNKLISSSTDAPKRGQPKKQKETPILYIDHMPIKFQPHVSDVKDVAGDGNCGFRAVAALLGHGEHMWLNIRNTMTDEMKLRVEKYVDMYGVKECETILNALKVTPTQLLTRDYWLTIPEMGYIIASAFKVVLITLSISGCSTFLPLSGAPPRNHRIIVIGHVNENHWVQVMLRKGHPIPLTAPQWKKHCDPEAEAWELPYLVRMKAYQKELEDAHKSVDKTVVNLSIDE